MSADEIDVIMTKLDKIEEDHGDRLTSIETRITALTAQLSLAKWLVTVGLAGAAVILTGMKLWIG